MQFVRQIIRSCAAGAAILLAAVAAGQAPLPIYTDYLVNGFQDWGWATHNYSNTNPVHSGSNTISVTISSPWQGLQMWHSDFKTAVYSSLSLWMNGGAAGGQKLQVYALLHIGSNQNSAQTNSYALPALPTNAWQQFIVPLSALNVVNYTNCTGFVIQDRLGATQPTFYVDDIQLNAAPPPSLVHLSLNATQAVRVADARWFGFNTALWDGNLDTPTTISLLQEMGTRALRGMGGSLSDEYHWESNTSLNNTWQWASSFPNLAQVATNTGAQVIITANYGTGSSNEAAAWVAYANASTTNTVALGTDSSGTNWHTAGYWASIRAAAPLPQDDGRNFLRLSRAAPLGFKYWEIGNECYGSWETDSNAVPHDPFTYATRARDYLNLMRAVDGSIKIGVVAATGEGSYGNTNHFAVNPRTGTTNYGWTPVMLTTLKGLGATPDFAIHHRYPEYTDSNNPKGSDSDVFLLQDSTAWAQDAADLRQQLSDYFSPQGTNVELLCTENNSDAGAPGRQSTSLVNGFYFADSLGQLMKTEFNSLIWWDLRNGTDTTGCFDSILYGWRNYGDLGVINGLNTRHPVSYAAKLMQYFVQPGETILSASSDFVLLHAYAARRASGAVSLLVLNTDTFTNFNAQIALTGFVPGTNATVRSYGIPQDEAARTNAPLSAQDIATNTFSGASATFNYTFPPLSLSLFALAPAAPMLAVVPPTRAGGQFVLQIQGQPNVRYVTQTSSNLSTWTNVSTNTLVSSTLNLTNSIPSGAAIQFWRAVWQP
ncbi:MAG: alpha-L-arabinofuranosidase [Verrucomicrobia bacterium]|nr:MAG: alpha-L-arabinofuranosidase [Verrucomicrobiota bacterium]